MISVFFFKMARMFFERCSLRALRRSESKNLCILDNDRGPSLLLMTFWTVQSDRFISLTMAFIDRMGFCRMQASIFQTSFSVTTVGFLPDPGFRLTCPESFKLFFTRKIIRREVPTSLTMSEMGVSAWRRATIFSLFSSMLENNFDTDKNQLIFH
jgi:hypothetical protein